MIKTLTAIAAALLLSSAAHASSVVVDAYANSYTGGVAADSLTFATGDEFTVSVAATDLWSSGPVPRWSNADGQTVALYATGSDESGEAATTLIGTDAGIYSTSDGAFAVGELVGRIGTGAYFGVGTNYAGTADSDGTLQLFFWDNNYSDNAQFVTAEVTAVPEPTSIALLLAGLGVIGLSASRRAKNAA